MADDPIEHVVLLMLENRSPRGPERVVGAGRAIERSHQFESVKFLQLSYPHTALLTR
jgi:hypothetical protein